MTENVNSKLALALPTQRDLKNTRLTINLQSKRDRVERRGDAEREVERVRQSGE